MVDQEVPINPALGVVQQIEHDVVTEALGPQPVAHLDAGTGAALGGEQHTAGREMVRGIDSIVAVSTVLDARTTAVPYSTILTTADKDT